MAYTDTQRSAARVEDDSKMFFKQFYFALFAAMALPSEAQAGTAHNFVPLMAQARAERYDELVVMHKGQVEATWSSNRYPAHHALMSVTKSVAGLAIGGLIDDGRLHLNDKMEQFFPAWRGDPRGEITVDQILAMTSGLSSTFPDSDVLRDCVGEALRQELLHTPGTHWAYNNDAVNLLAGIVQQVTGMSLQRYTQQLLFEPMGIVDATWEEDAHGQSIVMCGLAMSPVDLAKLGQLVLDRGVYRGRRILSAAWIDALAFAAVAPTNGRLWWLDVSMSEEAQRLAQANSLNIIGGNGSGGQFLLVERTTHIVVVLQTEVFANNDRTTDATQFDGVLRAFVDLCIASRLRSHEVDRAQPPMSSTRGPPAAIWP